ncbi:adenylosuccinate synthetase [Chryseobacterium sp. cx-311]|uniref:adenylosuccinate synthetase n=1 Tax=Marnyiella aurantia TaxID=2758037 RepID=UPI001AE7E148|nr:adenylosuccinate synthetase [Marnyiella aurantia]MBP0613937.1 adenylosuccinate synthetase [Marnyiella aurantia]
MVKKAYIVVGLGFGDEGKGIVTDFLSNKYPDSINVRFNGGHQAGHCVVNSVTGESHIFSNLGSGTFRGLPTYWSSYCTFAPSYFVEEVAGLDIDLKFFIHPNSPVTTHYDILYNKTSEISLGHRRKGSCGVGFGATIDRNQIISFTVSDLFNEEKFLIKKLGEIRNYYKNLINIETSFDFSHFDHEREDLFFMQQIDYLKKIEANGGFTIVGSEQEIFKNWNSFIFEGSQGILIDQNFGTKPYITKSNTTSQNAIKMITQSGISIETEIFYVTRVYQTRHGNGPFKEKNSNFYLINNSAETNVDNEYQGKFRANFLDLADLRYAIACDNKYSKHFNKNLVITCLDHMESEDIPVYDKGELVTTNYRDITDLLNLRFKQVYFSKSNQSENIFQ